jgi:hypothetical protein
MLDSYNERAIRERYAAHWYMYLTQAEDRRIDWAFDNADNRQYDLIQRVGERRAIRAYEASRR